MAFSDYTSPDSVRAALGVSAREAPDTVITDNIYLIELLEEMDSFGITFRADYLAARDAEPRSAAQNRLVLLAQAFGAYTIALKLIPILGALVPGRTADGKSEMERINNPYENMRAPIEANRNVYRTRLRAAYAGLTGTAVNAPGLSPRISVVGLGTDPITG